jgi:hypothetical protein
MTETKKNPKVRVRTSVKAGGWELNHGTRVRSPKVQHGVRVRRPSR